MAELRYSDNQPLESGDAALLRELEQKVEAARAKFTKWNLSADYRDLRAAMNELRSHCRTVLAEGCSECDEHNEVVTGWTPIVPQEAIYAPCPTCAKRIDSYLQEKNGG